MPWRQRSGWVNRAETCARPGIGSRVSTPSCTGGLPGGDGSVRWTTACVKQTRPTIRSSGSVAMRVHQEPSVILPRQRSSSRPGGGGSHPGGAQLR
jgi:hypothetical protein